ncbi:hypothetical protein [Dictyobacter aurantiacus]|uniref:ATP-grasp ribosomal peptide maturase n=1 Tax=Dictyobacter aurantiacus TaxID=1936993 RepID=A0A401ZRJ1_9CHLR|nr:hypothetical protein [Dictyobacter aurantiacus]GCE09485.1 ATP-grasp ribosomal peptide maturase [Dictyobacter aurantiacus]
MKSHVLILTQPSDGHATMMLEELQYRGVHVTCCNVADFPGSITASCTLDQQGQLDGTFGYQGQTITLDTLTGIWWRRPTFYKAAPGYTSGEQNFIELETQRGFLGLLESAEVQDAHTLWVSRYHAIRRADLKPLQLTAAQQLGLRIPRTLITNDPQRVKSFYDICQGRIILKSVARGVIEGNDKSYLYTNEVGPEYIDEHTLERVRVTAHLFQEAVGKAFELRVVIIGQQIFAAEIHSQHTAHGRIDFRRDYPNLTYKAHQLPDDLAQKLFDLVRFFGLQYSSMDLIVTPAGEYVWLELNPNGQFYWLQKEVPQLHLKEAMANLLSQPEEYRL